MKSIIAKILTAVIAASTLTASAIPVQQLTPTGTTVLSTYYITKNGTGIGGGNSNNTANQLHRLVTYFIDVECDDWESYKPTTQVSDWSGGGLAGWDYAVIHYGAGAYGGAGAGGSVGAYALNGNDTFIFPSGSFSSINLYRCDDDHHSTPDGGSTILLIGIGLVGLEALRRKLAAA